MNRAAKQRLMDLARDRIDATLDRFHGRPVNEDLSDVHDAAVKAVKCAMAECGHEVVSFKLTLAWHPEEEGTVKIDLRFLVPKRRRCE